MQHVLLQYDSAIAIDVGIGEIDRQSGIVIAHIRSEQQRLELIQKKLEPGEITGVGVKQTVRSAG